MFGTLQLGLSLTRGQGGGGGYAYTVYVDSVGGDDGNDGLTELTALQTLGAAQTLVTSLGPGGLLSLARGSYWREQYDITVNGLTIAVHGTGDMPVIDGADIVTSGWTQPDAVTYPNVWSRSWSRASATTTLSEMLGYWEAGARTTRQTSLANLQAGSNGHWHTTSLTTQTSTVSIRSAADPNSDGILREFTKRHYGINGHAQILTVNRTGNRTTGPIEIKRCVGHYNAFTGPKDGTAKRLFLRDGNIHHSVTEGLLTEDVIGTEYSPDTAPSIFAAYRADGSAFDHTFRRVMALTPGGASRYQSINASAFYAHASTGDAEARNIVAEQCVGRGVGFGSAIADSFAANGCYSEDPYNAHFVVVARVNTFQHCIAHDTTSSGTGGSNRAGMRRFTNATFTPELNVGHCAINIPTGAFGIFLGNTYPTVIENTAILCGTSTPVQGVTGDRCAPTINRCIMWGGRSYAQFQTGYVGDYNVFYFVGQVAPQFDLNGTVYGGLNLTAWQTASGQDANSVFLKAADQVSGNGIAFWLGFANGENNGPADGDWRINPSAKVYAGDGTGMTGTFADGVTPITAAGPQEHWDFNQRAVVSGAPTAYPTLPASIAEMRTYLEDPSAWDFYP